MSVKSLLAPALCLGLLGAPAVATEVVRVATYNILAFDTGSSDYDALVDMVRRMEPDVLCVQELWVLQGDLNDVSQFAADVGLPFHVTATAGGTSSTLRVATFSRWPICDSESWTPEEISGDSQANDLTRDILEVRISVPAVCGPTPQQCCGNLVVFNSHLKAGSFNSIDRFRRAVELQYRMVPLLEQALTDCPGAVVVTAGDFNENDLVTSSPVVWNSQPPGAPSSYELGDDVVLPFTYDPDQLLMNTGGPATFIVADASREDSPGSKGTFLGSGSRLDYIWASLGPGSSSLARPPLGTPAISSTEVYDSAVDNDVDDGFFGDIARKYGSGPLPFNTAPQASDHLPVFADLILEGCESERIGLGSEGSFALRPVASYSGTPGPGSIGFVRLEQAPPGQFAYLFIGLPLAPAYGTSPVPVDTLVPGLIPGGLISSTGVQQLTPFATSNIGNNGEGSIFAFFPDFGGTIPVAVQWLVVDPNAPGGCCSLSDSLVFTI